MFVEICVSSGSSGRIKVKISAVQEINAIQVSTISRAVWVVGVAHTYR